MGRKLGASLALQLLCTGVARDGICIFATPCAMLDALETDLRKLALDFKCSLQLISLRSKYPIMACQRLAPHLLLFLPILALPLLSFILTFPYLSMLLELHRHLPFGFSVD